MLNIKKKYVFLLLSLVFLLAGCPSEIKPPALPVAPEKPKKVALVLGGGGARGFAHIGVIKVLESHGIKPQIIVGTSAGSVAGALYASGYSGIQLQQLSMNLDKNKLTDFTLFGRGGILKGEALQDFVNISVHNKLIEQLPIKFACVAVNLNTGEPILFERGNVGMAVRASSSVPGVFQPTPINGQFYIDGGTASPVPVKYAKKLGADLIIAVDVSTPPDPNADKGSLDVILKTFDIMGKALRESERKEADILIVPDLAGIGTADIDGKHRAILAGEAAAMKLLPLIQAKLNPR